MKQKPKIQKIFTKLVLEKVTWNQDKDQSCIFRLKMPMNHVTGVLELFVVVLSPSVCVGVSPESAGPMAFTCFCPSSLFHSHLQTIVFKLSAFAQFGAFISRFTSMHTFDNHPAHFWPSHAVCWSRAAPSLSPRRVLWVLRNCLFRAFLPTLDFEASPSLGAERGYCL